jgi:hypothetical protein
MWIGKCRDGMTAERRRTCQTRNSVDRLPGRQARSKALGIDVLRYPGEENPAGTISPVRHSYQIQRDSLFHSSTLLTQSRRSHPKNNSQKKRRPFARSQRTSATADKILRPTVIKTPNAITPAWFVNGLLGTTHGLLIFFYRFLQRSSRNSPPLKYGGRRDTLTLSLNLKPNSLSLVRMHCREFALMSICRVIYFALTINLGTRQNWPQHWGLKLDCPCYFLSSSKGTIAANFSAI